MPYIGSAVKSINTRSAIDHQQFLGSSADTITNPGYYTFYVNYSPGNISVFVAGNNISHTDYTANNGTDVRISTSTLTINSADNVEIIGYNIPTSQVLERSDVNITGGSIRNVEISDSNFLGTNNVQFSTGLPVVDSTGNNVISESGGVVTLANNVVPSSSYMFRNKIINGDMRIAQRSTEVQSFSADGGGSGGFKTLDRFYHELGTNNGTYTLSQNSITDLPGFKKSLKVLCTASATPTGTGQFNVHQRFESNNFYDLAFGTTSAKSITYSFWVKTNVAGDYIIWFLNVPDQRMTSKKYTVSASETGSWKYISVTVNGDTGGSVFDADNSHAFQVRHVLASGGDYTSGTYMDGTWQDVSGNTGNIYAGQTANVSSDVNNYYEITGVQLEEGTVATPFEHRPYGLELSLCQRYFEKSYEIETSVGSATRLGSVDWNFGGMTTGGTVNIFYKVTKRATPTVKNYDPDTADTIGLRYWNGSAEVQGTGSLDGWYGGTSSARWALGSTSRSNAIFHWTAEIEL